MLLLFQIVSLTQFLMWYINYSSREGMQPLLEVGFVPVPA
jgi:hypothetical protein